MKDTALKVAGTIFFLLAILHTVRLILRVEITVGGAAVPLWFSVLGTIVPLALSVWMFKSLK